jgi:hypothetical protein
VAGIDGDVQVSTPAEPDLEQSDAVRDLWFIATTDPVRHIASTMIDFDTVKTRCGKVLDIEWAQMGRGRPTAADDSCAVCLEI